MEQDKVLTKMYSYIIGYLQENNRNLEISKDKKKGLQKSIKELEEERSENSKNNHESHTD